MKPVALTLLLLLAAAPPLHAQTIAITGLVAHPGPMDAKALAALPQTTVTGTFNSMAGKQTHTWSGPKLLDILNRAGLTDEPGKRTRMRHVILAIGTDSYAAAIALGEIDPKGEAKNVIVALAQDSTPLKTPRLVVPNDASLTRCVHDLASLEVR